MRASRSGGFAPAEGGRRPCGIFTGRLMTGCQDSKTGQQFNATYGGTNIFIQSSNITAQFCTLAPPHTRNHEPPTPCKASSLRCRRVSLVGARVLANVSVGLRGLGARAEGTSLRLDLQRVDVNLTGLFEPQEGEPSDGELSRVVSEIIGELLTSLLLDPLQQAAGSEAEQIALDALNRVLATMTVADLTSSFSQLSAMQSRKSLG